MIPPQPVALHESLRKPRASGDDPENNIGANNLHTVNPARAGMIRDPWRPTSWSARKPRASGDDPPSARPP